MRSRYRIVISTSRGSPSANPPQGAWARLKAALIAIGLLIVAAAVLVVALIFGSILAAALWVCLVLIVVAIILKSAWRTLKRGRTGAP